METKRCTKCGEVKPVSEFHKKKRARDGRQARCKACVKAYAAEWYVRNRERINERNAAWDAANRERRREVNSAWHAKNREHVAERKAAYYSAHPEKSAENRARSAEWYRENRDRIAERRATTPNVWWEGDYRKRMRGYGFEPRVSSFTREQLYERWGTRCFHCGSEDGTTLDHYPTPISRGGEHSLDNCRPSCMNCQRYSWREDFTPTAES